MLADFSSLTNMLDWLPLLIGIQIGPRIRVGGSVGKAGQQFKIGAGRVAKGAAPVVSMFNPAIGAGLAAAGTALDTSKGRVGVGDVALAGAKNYGLGKTASFLGSKIPLPQGVKNVGTRIGGRAQDIMGAIKDKMPNLPQGMNSINDIPGYGGAKRLLTGGGGGGGGEGMSLLDKLLMGGTIAAGTEDAMRRRGFEDESRRYAVDPYNARSGLRSRALQMLEQDNRPDHTGLFSDPGNVYDVQRRQQIAGG